MTGHSRDEQIAARIEPEVAASRPCSCSELTDHLFEFLDAELGDEHRERIRAHAASCESCTHEVDAEQHMREVIRRSCAERAPASLRVRIVQQLTTIRTMPQG